MPAYLVRTIEEHDLVGVFYASNPFELAFLIDEVLDPDRCEYQRLSPGRVIWDGPAVQIPLSRSNDDTSPAGITKQECVPALKLSLNVRQDLAPNSVRNDRALDVSFGSWLRDNALTQPANLPTRA